MEIGKDVAISVVLDWYDAYLCFRTGDSRGFAFVRYKYQDEAQKAVEKLDGN